VTGARRGRPPRLTADDWTGAALDAIADGGLAAVAIEPIAARLGATKGSFYWYFKNRDAFVEATVRRWEQEQTEQVAALLEQIPDPAARLRRLVHGAMTGSRGAAITVMLLADAADPLVAETVRRVTARRLEIVTGCFTALGQPDDRARHHALAGYTAYLGAAVLRRAVPQAAPVPDDSYIDTLLAALGVTPSVEPAG
jgi:AcrR family transcriptional regulator